jgi:hypothetical protein
MSMSETLRPKETAVLTVWPHYEVKQTIKTMANLRSFFPDGKANELNWCFLSTSGVHGTYATLDGMHEPEDGEEPFRHITVLVVQPRLVVMRYGNIDVETDEDERWLRELVNSTIVAVKKSQEGNL